MCDMEIESGGGSILRNPNFFLSVHQIAYAGNACLFVTVMSRTKNAGGEMGESKLTQRQLALPVLH